MAKSGMQKIAKTETSEPENYCNELYINLL